MEEPPTDGTGKGVPVPGMDALHPDKNETIAILIFQFVSTPGSAILCEFKADGRLEPEK